jgi:2-C-methyl-D-erythritol 4-phosphate cytidylyltransferase / 2-C-methyl-D-erythritol 2,4-cyclodiphosphate synthase
MTSEASKIAVIIVAAGQGQRLPGDRPKAYQLLQGQALLAHSLQKFTETKAISLVCVVHHRAHASWLQPIKQQFPDAIYVVGGEQRQDSVRLGLEALQNHNPDYVLVHDAARPFISDALIARILKALTPVSAVLPAISVTDSIKQEHTDGTLSNLPRHTLFAAQTPQGFPYKTLLELHRQYAEVNVTDDISLAELAHLPIDKVEGEVANRKITTAEDLKQGNNKMIRTGMGFDVHQLVPHDSHTPAARRKIRICGIDIASEKRLEGHSDGDVGLHALTDAILGALAAGDLGEHFPPSDPQWRGADSSRFLLHAQHLMMKQQGTLCHADLTLIAQAPRMAPHREAMRQRIADILHVPIERISVKATTTDHLGFTGRGEGIAAQAIVTLEIP